MAFPPFNQDFSILPTSWVGSYRYIKIDGVRPTRIKLYTEDNYGYGSLYFFRLNQNSIVIQDNLTNEEIQCDWVVNAPGFGRLYRQTRYTHFASGGIHQIFDAQGNVIETQATNVGDLRFFWGCEFEVPAELRRLMDEDPTDTTHFPIEGGVTVITNGEIYPDCETPYLTKFSAFPLTKRIKRINLDIDGTQIRTNTSRLYVHGDKQPTQTVIATGEVYHGSNPNTSQIGFNINVPEVRFITNSNGDL